MSNGKEDFKKSKSADQQKELLENAHQLSQAGLKEIKDFQVLSQILYKYETKRLERKLGKGHPRVQKWRKRTEDNSKIVDKLEVEMEIAKIDVPETPKEGAKLHGRITDNKNRGIPGLTVIIRDENGKPISDIDLAKTDHSGYYAFTIEKEAAEKIGYKNIYVSVASKIDETLYRAPVPLILKRNDQIVKNIAIDRKSMFTPKDRKKTPKTKPDKKGGTVKKDENGENNV